MKKRVLSMIMALVMALTLVTPTYAAPEETAEPEVTPAVEKVEPEAVAPIREPEPEAVTPPAGPQTTVVASGTCGDSLTWILGDQGTLTISGTGKMWNWANSNYAPWYSKRSEIKIVNIGSGVTNIGDYAFYRCSKLTSVTIPDSVTSIGKYAFYDCSGLTSVTIPDGVTNIGSIAFSGCISLASVTIPDSVTSIGNGAFDGCRSLTSVTIPDGVTSIGGYTFCDCSSLTSVTIPDSVTRIDWYAFYRCSGLTSVIIGSGVTFVGYEAFAECSNMRRVWFAGAAPEIKETFYDYEDTGEESGEGSFAGVTATVYYPQGDETWTEEKRGDYSGNLTWIPHNGVAYVFSQPQDVTACVGEAATFQVDAFGPELTYQWQTLLPGADAWVDVESEDAATDTISIIVSEELKGGAEFRCVITSANGNQMSSEPATLHVIMITAQPEDYTGTVGTTATFTVAAEGEELTYQWQTRTSATGSWNNSNASGNKTATLKIPVTVVRDGYQYRCVITAANGYQVISESATLHVVLTVVITTQPEDYTGAVGTTATFTVAATGEGLTYQWQIRTKPTGSWKVSNSTGNKTDTLKIPVTAARDGYQYRCVVTDVNGEQVISDPATLYVAAPLRIVSQPEDYTGAVGETAIFTVAAEGEGLAYQWQTRVKPTGSWNNSNAGGNKTDTLKITVTAARDGYAYRCVITDAYGNTVTTEPATLHVAAPLRIVSQPEDFTGAVGETAIFTVAAEGEDLTYQWQIRTKPTGNWNKSNSTGNKTATLKIPVTAARDGYAYRCVITDASGNTVTSDPATLHVGGPATVVASGTCGANLTWTLDNKRTLTISGTGAMTNWDGVDSVPWYSWRGYFDKVNIVNGVTSIGNSAFYGCNSLTGVTIPNSVTNIENYAFGYCRGLTSVMIPASVTSIGSAAFCDCSSLTSVTIPAGVTSIGGSAFSGCSSLTSVTIPSSVTSIGSVAFSGCRSLTSVTIPDSVTNIGNGAFSSCTGLTSVTIPAGVTSMGSGAFSRCSSLMSISVSAANEHYRSVDGVLFNKSMSELIQCPGGRDGTYSVPAGVTSIGNSAFSGCTGLTSVTIPDGVTSIKSSAFSGCTGLTSVMIPDGVIIVEWYAFSGCGALESVIFGNDVAGVGYAAFMNCSSLRRIWFAGSAPQFNIYNELGTDLYSFYGVTATVYYPQGDETWTEERRGNCGGNLTWIPHNGVAYIMTQPQDATARVGETATFQVDAFGPELTYQWQTRVKPTGSWNNSNASGNKTATLKIPVTAARDGYAYRCVITDASGNTVTSTHATLHVAAAPTIVITAEPEDYTGAVGTTATFTVAAEGEGLTYQWQIRTKPTGSWNVSNSTGNKTATLKIPVTVARDGYAYRCVITDASGNTATTNAATLHVG